ncbi:MAG TPA: LPS assembly protein LptD [Bryobacteraceae bacterium]|nr:LPS assembly protein LptD [Bryobacteraceae bacterium]
MFVPQGRELIPKGEVDIEALSQEREGPNYKLRGRVKLETAEMVLRADELDYNEETGDAEARGNVRFEHFVGGETIQAERVEYNVNSETGKYYDVRGSSPARLDARPGILTTTSPFSFQGKWAERIENRYILHDGFITNCRLPKPWWILKGPTFDIIPGDRVIARNSTFYVRKVPLFFTPVFYKSLQRMPRKSGFLTPSLGNSSRRGMMVGGGYYWAINRSYDVMYRGQYFSQRGLAHNIDFRGKPAERTDVTLNVYGVQDRGRLLDNGTRIKEGGYLILLGARSELPKGFSARILFNYLSSFTFRQAFTENFFEAIFSEVHSVGYVTKHWSSFGLNAVVERNENFQNVEEIIVEQAAEAEGGTLTRVQRVENRIVIRKLPSLEFLSRDRPLLNKNLPVWISFRSSGGLVSRSQKEFRTGNFVDRLDVEPRIMTAIRWKDFHLTPAFSIRETNYGSTFDTEGRVQATSMTRSSREFSAGLAFPSLVRVFNGPSWLGEKVKHVIEPRANFRYVSGVGSEFRNIIRFDENELLSNTTELEVSVANRIYAKRAGLVREVLSLEVTQRRFFDPTFGGAVVDGRRNVLLSTATLTGYTFLDGPRRYSPVVSVLRMMPTNTIGIEWRTDYDPLRSKVVNSSFTADARLRQYFFSFGHTQVGSVPALSPSANQLRGLVGIGQENKRGWSAAFTAVYDYTTRVMQFATTQVTYNTDCCGLSVQYRRFNFGVRNENQFRIAFAVANIGSFGTLRRQERIF